MCFLIYLQFLHAILSAKVKYNHSKPLYVITNRVLVENKQFAYFLKAIHKDFDSCGWYSMIELEISKSAKNNDRMPLSSERLRKIRLKLQQDVNAAFKERCLYFSQNKLNQRLQQLRIQLSGFCCLVVFLFC